MTPDSHGSLPAGRDADTAWVDHQVATRLFGAMPRRIGHYTILETLGSGGMGLVYRAHDTRLARSIAVKLLNADYSTSAGARLLEREAQAMARLSHANVVQVYEVGQYREQVFLAMEYVDGETLEIWLRRAPSQRAVVGVFLAIGEGIAAAHGVNITHRDLKPSNILIDRHGRPKVADFGLARLEMAFDIQHAITAPEDRCAESRITLDGQMIGTPRFMAPEQHAGSPATHKSDQFSYAMMLWEALFGEAPFAQSGENAGLHGKSWTLQTPRRRVRVSRRLRMALERGLSLQPALRWPSMKALLGELDRPPWHHRHGLMVVLAAALMLVTALSLLVVMPKGLGPNETSDPCPDLRPLRDIAQKMREEWATHRAAGGFSPTHQRLYEDMLARWQDDIEGLCGGDGTVFIRRSDSAEVLHRGACMLRDASVLRTLRIESSVMPLNLGRHHKVEIERPIQIRDMSAPCTLTTDEGYELLLGGEPIPEVALAISYMSAKMRLANHQPREALLILERDFRRYFPGALPGIYYVARARALYKLGWYRSALEALYLAEDAAETAADALVLFDARVLQVLTVVAMQLDIRQRDQVEARSILGDSWRRKLMMANNILPQAEKYDDTAPGRLLSARILLAEAQGEEVLPAMRLKLLEYADAGRHPDLQANAYFSHAASLPWAEGAMFRRKAIALAASSQELSAYLSYNAGLLSFLSGETMEAIDYMTSSCRRYGNIFGPSSRQVANVGYATAHALLVQGESRQALAYADMAVSGDYGVQPNVQRSTALYLRSAIRLRLGDADAAVADAKAGLAALPVDASLDTVMWRTVMETAVVEALTAARAFGLALELASQPLRTLDGDARLEIAGQRDELKLASAKALAGEGKVTQAKAALEGVVNSRFLAADGYKRAEALLLRARLSPGSADAAKWRAEGMELLAGLGTDGARRLAHEVADIAERGAH